MKGIDVYQGEGTNHKLPLKSIPQKAYDKSDFVIVKATQGVSYKYTSFFHDMAKKVLADGKLLGAYHYAAGNDPVKEADYFISVVKSYLGKTVLCLDWESMQNSKWGNKTWCTSFINRIKTKTGLTCVLYTGLDGIKQNASLANKIPLWFAGYPKPMATGWTVPKFKYNISPWKEYAIWQYTSTNEQIDRNVTSMTPSQWRSLSMEETKKDPPQESQDLRKLIVNTATMLLGVKEGSKEHKMIIDTFNKSGLCPRYRMTMKDAWCATFVSFLFIATKLAGKQGSGKLFQCVECSCNKMIDLAKKQGIWNENDKYVPKAGDLIFYDWQDSGSGDNKGVPDHVGVVQSCDGKTITVIEGNYKDSVGIRKIAVNGKCIRGFICPKYADAEKKDNTPASTAKPSQKASQSVKKGYTGKFPALPPRGYFKFGDGYIQYRGYNTQVKRVQQLINWIINGNIKVDGDYGQKTEDAVRDAQGILKVKQDGLFGSDTLAKARVFKK